MDASALESAEFWLSWIGTLKLVAAALVAAGKGVVIATVEGTELPSNDPSVIALVAALDAAKIAHTTMTISGESLITRLPRTAAGWRRWRGWQPQSLLPL